MTYDHWKTTNPEDEFLGEPPEVFEECPECCGEGYIEKWESVSRWSIDSPSGYAVPCHVCGTAGGMICEAEGDR